MYIYPSIFRAFGGKWFDPGGRDAGQQPRGSGGARVVRRCPSTYAPPGGAELELAGHRRRVRPRHARLLHRRQYLGLGDHQSERSKVVGKIGFARWPRVRRRRVSSIWNWGFRSMRRCQRRRKPARPGCSSRGPRVDETQIRTSYGSQGPSKRFGVNRMSIWQARRIHERRIDGAGHNFLQASTRRLTQDTDVDWRPRVPQWPAIGETMATSIQAALVGSDEAEGGARRGPAAGRAHHARQLISPHERLDDRGASASGALRSLLGRSGVVVLARHDHVPARSTWSGTSPQRIDLGDAGDGRLRRAGELRPAAAATRASGSRCG